MKKFFYVCSVILPLIDAIVGTIKGLKKGLKQFGDERCQKEQYEKYRRTKSNLFN